MLACFALALVSGAPAQENSGSKPEKAPSKAALKKYDADHDGKLSEEEKARQKADAKEKRDKARQEALEKYDADKDGKLEREEREKMKEDKQAAREAKKAEKAAKQAENAK